MRDESSERFKAHAILRSAASNGMAGRKCLAFAARPCVLPAVSG
jgi:hypothetical protein